MKISWNWLTELVDLKDLESPQKLADLLTHRGLEVEEVTPQAQGFESVIIAQIQKKERHPEADRLSLCEVTTGTGDPLQIVCGAQNMKAGDKVALAQIGAHLPNGLKIAQGKIRGQVSYGMLCSEEELKLKDSSEGILILPPDAPLGSPLDKFLGLDDWVLTLKLTANRGDCMSHYGLAREIASALGKKARLPEAPSLSFGKTPIQIDLQAGKDAPQFLGCLIEGVQVGPSPDWVVKRLEAVGSRSINNVVDATNYVMLELGHPVHGYDADLIQGASIGVRKSTPGEKLPLLDDSEVQLQGSELVIFDADRSIGLAGVMGGGNSEVNDKTTRVFLECAQFDPILVRRAASAHGKRTEASARFEKGVDPTSLERVISRLAQLVTEWAGGKVHSASKAVAQGFDANRAQATPIEFQPDWMNSFLGTEVPAAEIRQVLEGLDCQVEATRTSWKVTPPSYRRDLTIREDLAEEVARSVGYDRIPATIPPLTGFPYTWPRSVEEQAKEGMMELGFQESINYGFTSQKWLSQFGMNSSVHVQNPLSEEMEAMVPSLLPGLIQNIQENMRRHFGSEPLPLRFFEMRPVFQREGQDAIHSVDEMNTNVKESLKLSFVMSGPRWKAGLREDLKPIDFYDLKAVVETLIQKLGTKGVRFLPLEKSRAKDEPLHGLFHPYQCVEILAGKEVAGYYGMMHPSLVRSLKLKEPLWMGELSWDPIKKLSRGPMEWPQFRAWSEFPPMERDFALLVKPDVTSDQITQLALKAGKPLAKVAKIFDVYRGSQVAEGMTSLAVRVIFSEEGRSLQEAETENASAQILQAWKKDLGVELRS